MNFKLSWTIVVLPIGLLFLNEYFFAEEELWSFKYAPKSGTDLVVHKKKLDSLREFFDSHNGNLTAGIPNLLLISGIPLLWFRK